ncbi:hypothetical protein ACI0FM_12820 [Paenochrobactrum sp. BZR 588]|uniref:hypothetical protein n=1 Tax=Paenochrobactrum TaxID=999488 RepID=UPI0035BC8F12
MSTQMQMSLFLGSIAFMVLVGSGFIVILTVPALAKSPVYPMIILAAVSFIITPFIGWVVAGKIQSLQKK